jgi:5-methyltetrahydrofolate--homocysteine methyltransferase
MTMISRLQARYQGKRYSFGYPACPALEAERRRSARDDVTSFQRPQGVASGSEQRQPSVSALVFHHPDYTYFGVGDATE